MKNFIRTFTFVLIIVCSAWVFAYAESAEISGTANYILSAVPDPQSASVGGEWAVIGIHRGGAAPDSYFENYINNLNSRMARTSGDLGRKYTEYSRIAMALSELGAGGAEKLLPYLNDVEKVTLQGINGPIFALRAKAACSDADTEARDRYIEYILSRQNPDGSFGLSEGAADTDITAMAITALAAYPGDARTERAVNRAFLYLSSVQLPDGGFSENRSEPRSDCESAAQVIIAMKAYGLAPNNRFFVKNGKTPLDALAGFRCADGGYRHLAGDENADLMSTEQALLALTETQTLEKTLIYDKLWFDAGIKYTESEK